MGNKLKEIFSSKPPEWIKKLEEQACRERWCSTCKHYIPEDEDLPGFVTVYPECKLGGLAMETCLFYEREEVGK